jgi:hypothetical protein
MTALSSRQNSRAEAGPPAQGNDAGLTSIHDSVLVHRRRAPVRAFAPIIGCGAVGLLAVVLVGLSSTALATGLGSVLAASVSVYAAFVSYRLKQEDDARIGAKEHVAELRGIAAALRAEIDDNARHSGRAMSAESIMSIWDKMDQDPTYFPFIVQDDGGSQVYAALIERLIPFANYTHPVVTTVVEYHAAEMALNQSIAACRSKEFRELCNPADTESVKLYRSRQMKFVARTLLGMSDVYDIPLPEASKARETGKADLADLIEAHATHRQSSVEGDFLPFATRAANALKAFEEDAKSALSFLHTEITRR